MADDQAAEAIDYQQAGQVSQLETHSMSNLPQDLQSTRAVEDELVRLGKQRRKIEQSVSDNIQAITDAMTEASAAGIAIEDVSKLVGESRQTLYRWKDAAIRMA